MIKVTGVDNGSIAEELGLVAGTTLVSVNGRELEDFGVQAEGNVILATWMGIVGPAPALLGAKLLALACGVLLYIRGVHRVLAALTAFYAVGAVGPWLVFLNSL